MAQTHGTPQPHMPPMPMFGAPYNPFMQYQPTPASVPVSTAAAAGAAQSATGQSLTVGGDQPQVPGQESKNNKVMVIMIVRPWRKSVKNSQKK